MINEDEVAVKNVIGSQKSLRRKLRKGEKFAFDLTNWKNGEGMCPFSGSKAHGNALKAV